MPLPITPENLPGVLAGIGAVLTAIAGWGLWRVRKDPPEAGSMDAIRIALAENTKALHLMGGQFGENMRLFNELNKTTERIKDEASEARRLLEVTRDHLASIRDVLNRRQL